MELDQPFDSYLDIGTGSVHKTKSTPKSQWGKMKKSFGVPKKAVSSPHIGKKKVCKNCGYEKRGLNGYGFCKDCQMYG